MDTEKCFNLSVIHQGLVTIMRLVPPPIVMIEGFDWQNYKHFVAPLKHSVVYFKKIGEPGDEPSVSSTACIGCFLQ